MEVVQVEYRRVRNLGNYETAELKMIAVVGENEDANNVAAELKHQVLVNLGLAKVKEVSAEPKDEKKVTKKVTKKTTKKVTKKAATKKVEEPEVVPSAEEMKALAVKVVKTRGMEVAKAVLANFDAAKTSDLVVADYVAAQTEFNRALS